MRIIAGDWRSRKLVRAETRDTRPMPDRVKAAVFSMLGSHYGAPGALPPLRVADVFAGTGSMGLEALSRGAFFCSFFERHPKALRGLEQNVAALDAEARSEIIRRDAWRAAVHTRDRQPFDLVFLDPPYRESADPSAYGPVRQYLARLAAHATPTTVVVLHHEQRVRFMLEPEEAWRVVDERRFGSNALTLFLRSR